MKCFAKPIVKTDSKVTIPQFLVDKLESVYYNREYRDVYWVLAWPWVWNGSLNNDGQTFCEGAKFTKPVRSNWHSRVIFLPGAQNNILLDGKTRTISYRHNQNSSRKIWSYCTDQFAWDIDKKRKLFDKVVISLQRYIADSKINNKPNQLEVSELSKFTTNLIKILSKRVKEVDET